MGKLPFGEGGGTVSAGMEQHSCDGGELDARPTGC